LTKSANRALTIGFYVNWDERSFDSLKLALPYLDWLIPAWLNLQGSNLELKTEVDWRVLNLVSKKKPSLLILPMIQNAFEGKWEGPPAAQLLADSVSRSRLVDKILNLVATYQFKGITIDFEDLPADAHKDFQTFLAELSASLHERGLVLVLAVPFSDSNWPYETYATIADFLLLMAYDEHYPEGSPGSIAGRKWFTDNLDKQMKILRPDRTIISIGNYGYDWVDAHSAESITFQDAMSLAKKSLAPIEVDPSSQNPHFSFSENGDRHNVWFLNAKTAYNQIQAAEFYRPAGYALWRLGAEDPAVWAVLGRPHDAPARD